RVLRGAGRAPGVQRAGPAPAADEPQPEGAAPRRHRVRGRAGRDPDLHHRREDRLPGRSAEGRRVPARGLQRPAARRDARHPLPDRAVPVRPPGDRRPDPVRRLPAVPAAAAELRGAVRGRPAPARAAAGGPAAGRQGPGRRGNRGQRLIAMALRRVAVLGAGSWGTALAALIARHGHDTVLWGRDAATIEAVDRRHENPRYLPGIPLPDPLRATSDLGAALGDADLVLVVVPSHAFTDTLHALAPLRPAGAGVAWATKGFEPGSGRFLHEVAAETLGPGVPLAVVTGPSFAKEVAQGLPTAVTVQGEDADFVQQVADVLHGPEFRAYTGDDMRGAELGGAMKNVLAVATGAA